MNARNPKTKRNFLNLWVLFSSLMWAETSLLLASSGSQAGTTADENKVASHGFIRPKLLDYSKFDHSISVTTLRSGNQDESGENHYYFTLIYSTHVEQKLGSKTKIKPMNVAEKIFGTIKIKALSTWTENTKEGRTASINIGGDELRSYIAKSMQELKKEEIQLYMTGKITLYEKNKKFFFFGEDKKIASTTYSPVPKKGSFTPIRHNQLLEITDKKSTEVKLNVIYKSPLAENAPLQNPGNTPSN